MLVAAGAGVAVLAVWQAGGEHREPGLPPDPGQSPVAYAAGTSAANIALDAPGERVALRWVARHAGTIERLHLQAKVATPSCRGRDDGREGYAEGDTGRWLVTTHPVAADGTPDTSTTLARDGFRPCDRVSRGTFSIPLGLDVDYDAEFVTVVQNVSDDPGRDFASLNFLFSDPGLRGANAEDERSGTAEGALYGLDPREAVGWSEDGGQSWRFPGGPYGPDDGAGFVPTYVQEYADGVRTGQPYYYADEAIGDVGVRYPDVERAWTIDALGAHTFGPGAADVVLRVDGEERARVRLEGEGWLEQEIEPVEVPEGADVEVATTAGPDGLGLPLMRSDGAWADLVGLGRGYRYEAIGGDADSPTTIYPLPAMDAPPPA